jgi:hypothetical protein
MNFPPPFPMSLDPDDAAIALCAALRHVGQDATIRVRIEAAKIVELRVYRGSVPFAIFPIQPIALGHGTAGLAERLQAEADRR